MRALHVFDPDACPSLVLIILHFSFYSISVVHHRCISKSQSTGNDDFFCIKPPCRSVPPTFIKIRYVRNLCNKFYFNPFLFHVCLHCEAHVALESLTGSTWRYDFEHFLSMLSGSQSSTDLSHLEFKKFKPWSIDAAIFFSFVEAKLLEKNAPVVAKIIQKSVLTARISHECGLSLAV